MHTLKWLLLIHQATGCLGPTCQLCVEKSTHWKPKVALRNACEGGGGLSRGTVCRLFPARAVAAVPCSPSSEVDERRRAGGCNHLCLALPGAPVSLRACGSGSSLIPFPEGRGCASPWLQVPHPGFPWGQLASRDHTAGMGKAAHQRVWHRGRAGTCWCVGASVRGRAIAYIRSIQKHEQVGYTL